jgi:hypothetical protein
MEHNSNPSEPQLAFYTAFNIKLFLQRHPQHCFIMINNPNFSASNNSRILSVSSEVVSQAGNGASASYLGDTRVLQE